MAAVLVSSGPQDADNAGSGDLAVFDAVTSGSYTGDNTDGDPNYIRFPPNETFDDLVVYISEYELYGEICGNSVVTIKDDSGTDVYVYNSTLGSNIGMVPAVPAGSANTYKIIFGEQIELCSSSGPCGTPVPSIPQTPLTVSGSGIAIDVP